MADSGILFPLILGVTMQQMNIVDVAKVNDVQQNWLNMQQTQPCIHCTGNGNHVFSRAVILYTLDNCTLQ